MIVVSKSIKIFVNRVVGPVFFIWLSYTIYQQMMQQPNLPVSLRYIQKAVYGPVAWKFWLVILLMLLNWMIEAGKWKIILQPLESVTLAHSFKAVLAGLSVGFTTPNRIGEYGGRALYISKEKRMRSVALTVVGSFSQLLITLFFGSLGLLFFRDNAALPFFSGGWAQLLLWSVFTITAFFTILYFRLRWIAEIARAIGVPEKWLAHLLILDEVHVTILLRVVCLSAIRYLVFLCQYILLLQVMHVHAGLWNAFWLISILYLILALIPTMALLELGIRGKAGILLFESFSANTVGIFAASTGIWLVNLVLPALAGGLLVIGHKIFNTKQ